MGVIGILGAARDIVVNVPPQPADDGLSLGSLLVAAGGVIAALAAIAAALITVKGADKRLSTTLASEGERLDEQLAAERERLQLQLAHEREMKDLEAVRQQIDDYWNLADKVMRAVIRASVRFTRQKWEEGREYTLAARKSRGKLQMERGRIPARFGPKHPIATTAGRYDTALVNWMVFVEKCALEKSSPVEDESAKLQSAIRHARRSFAAAARQLAGFKLPDPQ